MTALSDALSQAHRSALTTLAKQYVSGYIGRETLDLHLNAMGLTDSVDQERWYAALEILKQYGGTPPTPEPQSYSARRLEDPATEAQWNAYMIDRGGEDYPERAYGIRYTR